MFKIGPHLSTSRGYTNMGRDALKISATTFQFFSRNPRGSKMKKLDEEDIKGLIDLVRESNFGPLLAHAPYTLNLFINRKCERICQPSHGRRLGKAQVF